MTSVKYRVSHLPEHSLTNANVRPRARTPISSSSCKPMHANALFSFFIDCEINAIVVRGTRIRHSRESSHKWIGRSHRTGAMVENETSWRELAERRFAVGIFVRPAPLPFFVDCIDSRVTKAMQSRTVNSKSLPHSRRGCDYVSAEPMANPDRLNNPYAKFEHIHFDHDDAAVDISVGREFCRRKRRWAD